MKRELLADAIVIVLALILLAVGVIEQIAFPGGFTGQEPNSVILIMEIVGFAGMAVLGIERLMHDTKEGFREIMGDIVIISGGLLVTGMFLTILFTSRFVMYQVETLFIGARLVTACGILVLGIERLIHDAKRFMKERFG